MREGFEFLAPPTPSAAAAAALSIGEISGIIVGCLLALALIIGWIWFRAFKKTPDGANDQRDVEIATTRTEDENEDEGGGGVVMEENEEADGTTLVDVLPTVMFPNFVNIETDCPCCLEEMQPGEQLTVLPCEHMLHPACANGWFGHMRTCPKCRHAVASSDLILRDQSGMCLYMLFDFTHEFAFTIS